MNRILLHLLFAVFVFSGIEALEKCPDKQTIIFLNGTSSAGKSSIASKLQEICHPSLHVGFDNFFVMLSPSYLFGGVNDAQGFSFEQKQDDKGFISSVKTGPVARELCLGLHRAIKAFADRGFNLIIDEILIAPEDLTDYAELFREYTVYFISVKPPLEVAVQRERERGDRILGFARGMYDLVYSYEFVDLEIDSSKNSPEESARQIIEFVRNNPSPKAFQHYNHALAK